MMRIKLSKLRTPAIVLMAMMLVTLQTSSAQVSGKATGATEVSKKRSAAVMKSGRVEIEYISPESSLDKPLFERLRQEQVLEKLQAFFSPLKLPRSLLLRLQGCNGEPNAYYENGIVTVCVETVYDMVRSAQSRRRTTKLKEKTIVVGGFFHVFLHEVSHALFDYYDIPILGREEDAADQLAAYVILNLDRTDSIKLVRAAVYLYAQEAGIRSATQMRRRNVRLATSDLSGFHSAPLQRLYNILCMAYGADQRLYGITVKSGALPPDRAEGCGDEYLQVRNAFRKLIVPHIDQKLKRVIKQQRWLSLGKNVSRAQSRQQ